MQSTIVCVLSRAPIHPDRVHNGHASGRQTLNFCPISKTDAHGQIESCLSYAITSGAIASGFGYAVWYSVLPGLRATNAATVQLSVPVIAALGGALFLDEVITQRLILASIAVLGGITMVILGRRFPK